MFPGVLPGPELHFRLRMIEPSFQRPLAEPAKNGAWLCAGIGGHYDELTDPAGGIRGHWRSLLGSLSQMGVEELSRRWHEGQRIIHDNGVTYNVYGDPRGMDRPWELDSIPLVISPQEWSLVEAGVIQRARLLNEILADLYGPQQLLHDGHLPPELVFAHPGFLRPCHGLSLPGDRYLHVYAADLARDPSGQWRVIADRTQAPSGSGYALENRLVVARMLPDVFHDCNVRRLATYFQAFREMLMNLAPSHRENPRIVLLTPGPYNETYFEHAYLARYLGYTLVEGGDLNVRENRVFLKTLSGLLPVDVILRRQDDSYCDPLELRGDSTLGVAGLMQVVRKGNVAIANALGSGLAESAAMMPFLPALCRQLVGEQLKLDSAASFWCGDATSLGETLGRLDELVIKPAYPLRGSEPVFGELLSSEARADLIARLRAAPHKYLAQEHIPLSTAPVWTDHGLAPRCVVLRVYAVASGGTYVVMPGGLTRVTGSEDAFVASMQRGGGSKDTWVLAEGPVPQFSLLSSATQPIDVSRASFDLPSRVADNLYWLGRHVERVECSVRLVRSSLGRLSEEWGPGGMAARGAVADILVGALLVRRETIAPEDGIEPELLEEDLLSLVFDGSRRGGVHAGVNHLHGLAWLLRDRLSTDTWRVLSRLDQDFEAPRPRKPLHVSGTLDLLDRAILHLSAFSGLVMESMTRSQGWRFLDIGRRLERAIQVVQLLSSGLAVADEDERARLSAMLEIADSSITYRSRYLTSLQAGLAIDLLLIDEANPRSVAFQLARLAEHVEALPQRETGARRPYEARLIMSALTAVRLAQIEDLVRYESDGRRAGLEALLGQLTAALPALSDALTQGYLSHASPTRQLSTAAHGSAQ